jgi:hypothetical protein
MPRMFIAAPGIVFARKPQEYRMMKRSSRFDTWTQEMPATAPTILVLIPWFGRWPKWLRFFLESCRWNPTIDWLLISDCGTPPDLPPNVGLIDITLEAYRNLISARLGIDAREVSPYKLCDLKPALGAIHSDAVAGYDYWGFGDLDVIYGDIRSIYTPDVLTHDVISTHATTVAGHFALIRNSRRMVNAFRRVRGWRSLLSTAEHRGFDEHHFAHLFTAIDRRRPWQRLRSPYIGGGLLVERYSTAAAPIAWIDGTFDYPEEWYWREGQLTNNRNPDRGFLYLHFMPWQSNRWTKDSVAPWSTLARLDHLPPERPAAFRISRDGFASLDRAEGEAISAAAESLMFETTN